MSDRFSRQSFLGKQSDEIFANCRVGIVGLGGGGSHVAQQLAHIGVGQLVLFDPDKVDESNLNRLVGARLRDAQLGTFKTRVAYRLIKGVNPTAKVFGISKPWQESAELLRTCDVVFGCVDTYSARDELERACRRFLIPYVDIGMDVTEGDADCYVMSGQVIVSMPGEVCLRCLGFLNEDLLAQEAARYGASGGRPQVIWPNALLASAAVGIFVQLVTPWHKQHLPTIYLEYDGNQQTLVPSNRLHYVIGKQCTHFSSGTDLGDPFWAKAQYSQS